MRVLHVMASTRRRGAGSIVLGGASALAEAGLVQRLIVANDDLTDSVDFTDTAISVQRAPFDKSRRDVTRAILAKAIADFSPNVVHYWSGRAANFAPRAAASRSLAWHGALCSPDRLSAYRHCAWHAAASEDLARRLVIRGVQAQRVGVLAPYAAVSPAPMAGARAQFATPDAAPVILASTPLSAKRGLETLLRALCEIPGVYAWIHRPGRGEFDVEAAAAKLGLRDRVRAVDGGRTPFERLVAASDIVAFPAKGDDARNLIAAWAAGKPVVRACRDEPAHDLPGPVLQARWGDIAVTRDALRVLLEDAIVAQRLSESGKRAFEAHFTKPAFVRSAMKLYDRIRTAGERAAAA